MEGNRFSVFVLRHVIVQGAGFFIVNRISFGFALLLPVLVGYVGLAFCSVGVQTVDHLFVGFFGRIGLFHAPFHAIVLEDVIVFSDVAESFLEIVDFLL